MLRLWRRGAARWSGDDPHARLEVTGVISRLRSDLLHYSNESIAHQIAKIAPYNEDFAKRRVAEGGPAGLIEWPFARSGVFSGLTYCVRGFWTAGRVLHCGAWLLLDFDPLRHGPGGQGRQSRPLMNGELKVSWSLTRGSSLIIWVVFCAPFPLKFPRRRRSCSPTTDPKTQTRTVFETWSRNKCFPRRTCGRTTRASGARGFLTRQSPARRAITWFFRR